MVIENVDDLVSFLNRYHRGWRQHTGEERLAATNLPDDLPHALSVVYQRLGALVELRSPCNRSPFAAQDSLVPLSRLKKVDGMWEFAWENQGNWSARCPAVRGDPPVYSEIGIYWDPPAEGLQMICESLEHFLTTLCLQEAVMSSKHLFAVEGVTPQGAVNIELVPLWLRGRYVWPEPSHDFFMSAEPEVLVMSDEPASVWVASSQDPIDELLRVPAQRIAP